MPRVYNPTTTTEVRTPSRCYVFREGLQASVANRKQIRRPHCGMVRRGDLRQGCGPIGQIGPVGRILLAMEW